MYSNLQYCPFTDAVQDAGELSAYLAQRRIHADRAAVRRTSV